MEPAPRHLLDSDICIRLLRGDAARLALRIARAPAGSIAVSAISLAELMEGSARRGEAALASLDRLLESVPLLAFDAAAARAFPAARAARGRLDRLIAAHALSLGATLVTHNLRDFRNVAGLRIEDWT
ncbi:PIN domain-containing protein [Sphingosinithalassobacter sp. CS137]|uniref:PIN domain-containing protein n=1 Tax=Sphingosinithalassobacter sp. CS137 TaxID=2762748 RepID=UPI00165D95D6|nr:PIN domain-containing protein [Sphingosinithalassobacter sp. CS137]